MKKIILTLSLLYSIQLSAMSSALNFRTTSTHPLLYTLENYSLEESGLEIEPFYAKLYDPTHTNEYLILNQKNTIVLDQQGNGDLNPRWLNLLSTNSAQNYYSHVTFLPQMSQGGALFHAYAESDHLYIDVHTALLEMTTKINIEEVGNNNNSNDLQGGLVYNITDAYQAFTQSDWNYGKIGNFNHVVGLDDIQVEVGTTVQTKHADINLFGLAQAPTGTGTLAQYLFEPLIGTNHWGLGFGIEAMTHNNSGLQALLGANYRYIFSAWETRSFDLTDNGQWSRYMLLQPTYSLTGILGGAPTLGVPGINYMTQQAFIEGRNQLNIYAVLQQNLSNYIIKAGYNYYYFQKETINTITNIDPGYGLYNINNIVGGVTTASTAMINESVVVPDLNPIDITSAMLNLESGASSAISTNRFMISLQRAADTFICGAGINVDIALSTAATSTWAVWANFEYMFGAV